MPKENENIKADLSTTVNKIYDDLIAPSAKPIGKVISLLPRTIKVFSYPWENWVTSKETKLEEAIAEAALINQNKGLTEDEIVPPENFIAVPALQAISYSTDSKEIKSMFAHLLASASDKNTKDKVHPSFVNIIKNMSPFEAKLLKCLKDEGIKLGCSAIIRLQEIANPKILKSEFFSYETAGITISNNFIDLSFDYDLNELNVAFDNLVRLKLVSIETKSYVNCEEYYFNLFTSTKFKEIYDLYLNQLLYNNSNLGNYNQIALIKRITNLTDFGKLFVDICLS